MKIFVINLDSAKDRWKHYENDNRYTRWSATSVDDLHDNHPIFKDMVSYWNIDPKEHDCKCACYMSHTRLWRYIISNHLEDVLILEDDAKLVNPIPDKSELPQDGFTYLGGFTSHKRLTDGPKKVEFKEGINKIDHSEYRMLMLMAYYIPHWDVAHKMLQSVTERGRPRAIDTMVLHTHKNQYVSYPASFIERDDKSQIRKKKNKHSNEFYEWI
tara:strand:+ start:1690 stop:2331 length:642 start_codon:yes stop_codon:yes gene_type:complete